VNARGMGLFHTPQRNVVLLAACVVYQTSRFAYDIPLIAAWSLRSGSISMVRSGGGLREDAACSDRWSSRLIFHRCLEKKSEAYVSPATA
jgi:hypothetical protein